MPCAVVGSAVGSRCAQSTVAWEFDQKMISKKNSPVQLAYNAQGRRITLTMLYKAEGRPDSRP